MVAWTSQEGSGSDMAAFVLSKFIKKTTREKPGKSPGTPQESPGTPVTFFLDLDHSGSKVFFPFRLFVSVKWPWRPERLLKLCLRALKLGGATHSSSACRSFWFVWTGFLVTQKNLRYVCSFLLKRG